MCLYRTISTLPGDMRFHTSFNAKVNELSQKFTHRTPLERKFIVKSFANTVSKWCGSGAEHVFQQVMAELADFKTTNESIAIPTPIKLVDDEKHALRNIISETLSAINPMQSDTSSFRLR